MGIKGRIETPQAKQFTSVAGAAIVTCAIIFAALVQHSLTSAGLLTLILLALFVARHATAPTTFQGMHEFRDVVRVSTALGILLNWHIIGGTTRNLIVSLVLFVAGLVRLKSSTEPWSLIRRNPPLMILILAILTLSSVTLALNITAVFVSIYASFSDHPILVKARIGAYSAAVNLALGLLLAAAGVEAPYASDLRIQAANARGFGLGEFRQRFPIGRSWEDAPFLALFVIACSLFLVLNRAIRTSHLLVCLALSTLTIVGANGRVFLAALVALVVTSYLSFRFPTTSRTLALTSMVIALLPWWHTLGGRLLQPAQGLLLNSGFVSSPDALTTVEGRTRIWDVCLEVFRSASLWHKLFGFGPDGHIASGAAYQYASVLAGSRDSAWRANYYSPHNSILMLLLCLGAVITVLLLIFVVYTCVVRTRWTSPQHGHFLSTMLFIMGVASATSVLTLPASASSAVVVFAILSSPSKQEGARLRSKYPRERGRRGLLSV